MVNDVSKILHQSQTECYQDMEQKMASIRRNAVEAETVETSMKQFLHGVEQAYQQSFGHLDLDTEE